MFTPKNFTHKEVAITSDLLSEDSESGRYYILENGRKLPSVTTVTGWKKSNIFAKWRAENPKEASRVTRRGNKIHSVIEDYVNNKEIVIKDLPPNECELFLQMKDEVDKIDNVRCTEMCLASENVGLAGRADCIAEYDGKLSIIDFKGSTRKKYKASIENYFLQATAYSLMWQEMTGEKVDQVVVLIGCETGETQVFTDNPVNWVRSLRREIEEYNNAFPQEDSPETATSLF
tara:strand:- start:578 stop:1273 length:696 start_codon:yes stop_codon:yes gene_type:complete